VRPDTTPVPLTVATDGTVLLHTPPVVASVRVTLPPVQTVLAPLMVPADGSGFTVTAAVAVSVQQLPVVVYVIVAAPALTPVITPRALMLAMAALLLLQVPPDMVSVKVDEAPAQTVVVPPMVPALAAGFTVILLVAVAVPQAVVTT
jgi:hypothetical protein